MPRLRQVLMAACLALAASACVPQAGQETATPAPEADTLLAAGPQAPETACAVASDCAVKNVGNCCGYFPACVNKDSPVDPDTVRAECARSGQSSVCGWKDIQACDCVQGQCRALTGPIPVAQ